MGSAEFNIHVKEMLSPLAKVVGEKKTRIKFSKHLSKSPYEREELRK